jgi:uncharacterized protein (DUF169 family)
MRHGSRIKEGAPTGGSLRTVLRTLGEETVRKRRKLHNEELYILFPYSNIKTIKSRIRRKRWGDIWDRR